MEETNPQARTRVLLSLLAVIVAAAALRLFLLAGPQTELEADEAIVGLMARHILHGERPLFYYMQPYMGSLEAYLIAALFALFGSSTFVLKLVPMLGALLFVALLFVTGYRLRGLTAAIIAGLFGALPPAFLAIWSLKARGGYIEILVMGQLLILMTMDLGKRGEIGWGRGFLIGAIAGLGLWTNPLIAVYLIPVAEELRGRTCLEQPRQDRKADA
ncbi:MAG TPA: glycosyltransferase family 39 protein, partial [Chloroflexota bacterium]|nr:glycosyltransferase family 39 protein [Chloroflexota bacterium]